MEPGADLGSAGKRSEKEHWAESEGWCLSSGPSCLVALGGSASFLGGLTTISSFQGDGEDQMQGKTVSRPLCGPG